MVKWTKGNARSCKRVVCSSLDPRTGQRFNEKSFWDPHQIDTQYFIRRLMRHERERESFERISIHHKKEAPMPRNQIEIEKNSNEHRTFEKSKLTLPTYIYLSHYRFKPPDACYIELMRFRVRPPRNRELPLQLKAIMCVTGNKVRLVQSRASRKTCKCKTLK